MTLPQPREVRRRERAARCFDTLFPDILEGIGEPVADVIAHRG
jgi:hypothetical protein